MLTKSAKTFKKYFSNHCFKEKMKPPVFRNMVLLN